MSTVTRAQKIRLGIFLLTAAAILGGTVVGMVGMAAFEVRDEYIVRFAGSIGGLNRGNQVRYKGVRTGRVEDIEIDPNNIESVKVTLSLRHGTPIKKDTVAVLEMQGITGLKYIELTGGTDEAELLRPGDEIEAKGSTLDLLTERVTTIAQKFDKLVSNLVELTSSETSARLRGAMAEIEGVVRSVRKLVDDNAGHAEALLLKVGVVADDVSELLGDGRQLLATAGDAVRGVEASIERASLWVRPEQVTQLVNRIVATAKNIEDRASKEELGGTIAGVTELAKRTTDTVGRVDKTFIQLRENLLRALEELIAGAEAFAEFAQMLKDDPSVLLRGRTEEERDLP